jgi:hypothetical protein
MRPLLLAGIAALGSLAAVAIVAWPRDASAFCRTTTCTRDCPTDFDGCSSSGLQLWWATSCVGYSLDAKLTKNLPEAPVREAIRQAFFAWTEVDCGGGRRASMTFSPFVDSSCGRSEYRADAGNVNVMIFKDDDWTYRGIDGTLAKTTVTFDGTSGEILDADIEINSAYNNLSVGDAKVEYDLQSIVTHEIGHMIGLAHSSDFSATMFAAYDPGTTELRTLAGDDVKAVCAAYPPGRAASCDPTPRGGLSLDCPAVEASGGCASSASSPGVPGMPGTATTTGRGEAGYTALLAGAFGAWALWRRRVRA